MAIGDTYATLDELKAYLSLSGQSAVDDQMVDALQSSSREIERHCNRQFNRADTVSVRVYKPSSNRLVLVDDFLTSTGLVVQTDTAQDGTYATTWTAADYLLEPLNGVAAGVPGWPYYKIRSVGSKGFPVCNWPRTVTVQVTAQWGWASVPAPVKQACLILSAMAFQLKDAPLGVAGMGEFGVIRVRNSGMAEKKLNDYCRNRTHVE